MDRVVGAHLVGGLKAPDAESAMRVAGEVLGDHLVAVTDGETGERDQWIGWQAAKLVSVPGIEITGVKSMVAPDNPEYSSFPSIEIAPDITELPDRLLGYADAAEASYATFRRLRDEGALPADLKFQVSLPTPYASVVAWVSERDQERFFPIYAAAMYREVEAIVAAIPAADLRIQWDVAVEVGVLKAAMAAAGELASEDFIARALDEAIAAASGVEVGLHLCYGDYKHRHFSVPEDLSLCVDMANRHSGSIDFVHMPADRETGIRSTYYEPLRDLRVENLALGVVDYEGSRERTQELIAAASTALDGTDRTFAVATECGMSRIDERGGDSPSLEQLLELHALAAPIR